MYPAPLLRRVADTTDVRLDKIDIHLPVDALRREWNRVFIGYCLRINIHLIVIVFALFVGAKVGADVTAVAFYENRFTS